MMETVIKSVKELHPNTGQLKDRGLPKNPRRIEKGKFEKLKKSLTEHPEMLKLREVIAYDNDGQLVVVCGNMRLRAAKELGLEEVPTKILPYDTSIDDLKAYAIIDNSEYGEYDWDALKADWDIDSLVDWGVDVPLMDFPSDEEEQTEEEYSEEGLDDEEKEKKPAKVSITFKEEEQLTEFVAKYKEEIEGSYDCMMSVTGGLL